ncbi:MAG: hypothetical protein ACRER8_03055 [Pseudomonas sp.]|uniref:hypothetical protein n=1 Tax=Pseudomonas sp. TaxID=306 RepID=UPI003D6ECB8B
MDIDVRSVSVVVTALWLAPAAAAGDESTYGPCSPIANNTSAPVNISCPIQMKSNIQDAYLMATHPTKVLVEKVSIGSNIYDGYRRFLTVTLKNSSDLRAEDITVYPVREKENEPIAASKLIPVQRSLLYKKIGGRGITIDAGQQFEFPVVSIEEINTKLFPSLAKGQYCFYDASVEHPQNTWDKHSSSVADAASVRNFFPVALRLRIKYRTIFKQTITNYVVIFLVYGDTKRGHFAWYPSTLSTGALACQKR